MALTDSERAFLRAYVETDDADAQVRAWRSSGCQDGTEQAVKVRITKLTERADSVGFMGAVRRRAAILARAREREQADEKAQEQAIAREARIATIELSDEMLHLEAEFIRAGERTSVQGFSKLAGELNKMTAEIAGGSGGLAHNDALKRYEEAKKAGAERPAQPPDPPDEPLLVDLGHFSSGRPDA